MCADVGHLPDAKCWRDDGLLVSAYQISDHDGFCHRLSSDAREAEWDMIDALDPAAVCNDDLVWLMNPFMLACVRFVFLQGVKLTYVNGDHCNRANTAR